MEQMTKYFVEVIHMNTNHAQKHSLAVLRIATGLFLFTMGLGKLGWYTSTEPLLERLEFFYDNAPAVSQWYQDRIAQPLVGLWSVLIPTGEILGGLALTVGLLTRLTGFIMIVMVLNLNFANGNLFGLTLLSNPFNGLLLAVLFVIVYSAAGRTFGIDKYIARSNPDNRLW